MKKRFLTALNLACGKNKIVDQFHYIYFKDGNIYVSNGIVHIKQRMELHGFSSREIKMLDGFCMHKDVFTLLNKHSDIVFIDMSPVGLLLATLKIAGTDVEIALKSSKEVPGEGMIVQYIDNIFETFTMREKKEVALDPDTVTLIRKVFVTKCSGLTFRFNKGNGGMLVTPNHDKYQENAIVKPLLLTGEYKK